MKITSEVRESSYDSNSPFQEKEKEGEGRSKDWRSMEGEGEGSRAWWPMEGEGEGSCAWWPMEGERKILFTSPHFPPNQIYLNFQFFPLTLRFYFIMF